MCHSILHHSSYPNAIFFHFLTSHHNHRLHRLVCSTFPSLCFKIYRFCPDLCPRCPTPSSPAPSHPFTLNNLPSASTTIVPTRTLGNLVFRVDNYTSGILGSPKIVLMDSAGAPLVSACRKRLSLGETWPVYAREESANSILEVRKQARLLQSKVLAHVAVCGGEGKWGYMVEGSYGSSCCRVYDRRRQVAEIRRKEAVDGVGFGDDVFKLVVEQSELDFTVRMALVILLEQMFGSRR